tara:strand:- start:1030 stop:1329 length:300 start_codon:yes stop_codon:yes gene_type:complete
MKAYSNTPEGFNIVFPNGMTVSVTWYRKTTSDGGHTSAEVIVHKDNVRYEYEGRLWREGEGIKPALHPKVEWTGINCYVKPRELAEILDAAENYETPKL